MSEFKSYQIERRLRLIRNLSESQPVTAIMLLEKTDQIITTMLLDVEEALPAIKPWAWSPELVEANIIKQYWFHMMKTHNFNSTPDGK